MKCLNSASILHPFTQTTGLVVHKWIRWRHKNRNTFYDNVIHKDDGCLIDPSRRVSGGRSVRHVVLLLKPTSPSLHDFLVGWRCLDNGVIETNITEYILFLSKWLVKEAEIYTPNTLCTLYSRFQILFTQNFSRKIKSKRSHMIPSSMYN